MIHFALSVPKTNGLYLVSVVFMNWKQFLVNLYGDENLKSHNLLS